MSKGRDKQVSRPSNNLQSLDEIPKELQDAIKILPQESKQAVLKAFSLSVSKHHSGPLPDGDTLKVYAECIPNGGDRIMQTVEKQLEHRIKLENIGIRRSFNQSGVGQAMAFIVALAFGIIAWDLARHDKEVVGAIIGGVDIVGLVIAFIAGKKGQK